MTTEKQIDEIFDEHKAKICVTTGYVLVDIDINSAYFNLRTEIKKLIGDRGYCTKIKKTKAGDIK